MDAKHVAVKRGTKVSKRRGRTGPVRTVVELLQWPNGAISARLRWDEVRKGRSTLTLESVVAIAEDGLPAGYVLAKDRKAVRK